MVAHEVADRLAYEDNPVLRVGIGGETLRRRLDVPDHELDFAVLHDLKGAGGTDYFALPVPSAHGWSSTVTYVTDRPGGFSQAEIADLTRASQRLAPISDMYSQRAIARNLLNAYLGPQTGPRVLAGQIRRGTGEELTAVLWSTSTASRSSSTVSAIFGPRSISLVGLP
jgi:adenylate cyclase